MKNNYLLLCTKILSLIFALSSSDVMAQQLSNCSASPYPIDVKQADGSTLTIVGKGVMLNSWAETIDGYSVIKKNGIYEYATKVNGKLVASGVRAKNAKERKSAEKIFLQNQTKSLSPDPPSFTEQPTFYPSASNTSEPQKVGYPHTGNLKTILILIKYPDMANTYTKTNFFNLMNEANYRGTGSFKDFYSQSSFGQLNLTTDVFGWYTAANNYSYYGYSNGYYRSTDLVKEAVDAAEAAGVDFSKYDNDGDGVVDGIIVVHAGPGAEEGSQLQYIWSHRWVLRAGGNQVTYDGVLIDDYIMNPERRIYTSDMVGRGVFCHEFGHNLELPDLYDIDGGSEGLGEWSLMASASWLGNEHTPGNMCAWCRNQLGWLTPTVLNTNGSYSLSAASGINQVFRINTPLANEYFLLENRQKTGLDISLKGSGLAIFHINTNKTSLTFDNTVNADENLKGVDLEEADGYNDLDNQSNRGDGGDLFPGSFSKTAFNNTTNPNSKTYTNANTNISISSISIDGTGKASFNLNLFPTPGITSFAPTSGPAGVGVAIKGTNFANVTAVRFNGVTATQFYVASSTLLYAAVPAGASTGRIQVVTNSGTATSAANFTIAPISSILVNKTGLAKARSQHGAIATNGKIYAFGGNSSSGLLTSLEIYNPSTNTWSPGASMPGASKGMSFALGSNGSIYVVSGYNTTYVAKLYRYTPSTNTWTTLASIPVAVWEGAAAATSNGKVYVFGGQTSGSVVTNATRIYNIATNSWSTGANMPVRVLQHSAVTGADGKIYIIGGRTSTAGPPTGSVQIYNPATNTWATGASMLIPKVQFGAVLASNGKIYVIGGKASYSSNKGPFFHTVEIYTPSTNSWANGPVIGAQAGELEAASLNGNLYSIAGTDGTYRNYNFQLILAPVVPSGLTATAISSSQINLKWTDKALNETRYTVERATASGGPFSVIATLGANSISYSNTGLTAGKTYYYRVKASNTAGSSSYSNIAKATTPTAFASARKGIEDQSTMVNNLSVSPNPVNKHTTISFSIERDQKVHLLVYNMEGKVVDRVYEGNAEAGKKYRFNWDAGSHASGMYITTLRTEKGILNQKVMVLP